MSEPDFKISLDVEANLARLDNTLNQAFNKVSSAGQKMQAALFSHGVGGSGGAGMTGASVVASPSASGPGVTGTQVSFGGALNAGTQSQINAQLANAAKTRQQQWQQIMGPKPSAFDGIESGLSRMGIPMGSPMTMAMAGGAAAIAGGNFFLNYDNQRLKNIQAIKTAGGQSGTGLYGQAEQYRQLGTAFDNYQMPGMIGLIPGVNSLARSFMQNQALRKTGHTLDLQGMADATQQRIAAQRETAQGFGGYTGDMATLAMDKTQMTSQYKKLVSSQGLSFADGWLKDQKAAMGMRTDILNFNQEQRGLDIKSATQQSNLRAFGMNGLAGLMEVQRSFREPIALATKQNNPLLGALKNQQSAAIFESLMSGQSESQSIANPMDTALGSGSVRLGSTRNQSDAYLRQIALNTKSDPVPVAAR